MVAKRSQFSIVVYSEHLSSFSRTKTNPEILTQQQVTLSNSNIMSSLSHDSYLQCLSAYTFILFMSTIEAQVGCVVVSPHRLQLPGIFWNRLRYAVLKRCSPVLAFRRVQNFVLRQCAWHVGPAHD